jgi:uncharacterized protein (TIGR03067 family)
MKKVQFSAAVLALAAASALTADDAKDRKALHGRWVLVSATHNGKDAPKDDAVGKAVLTFDGDVMTMTVGDFKGTAKFKLDPTKTPPQIDMVPQEGSDKGKTVRGIYEVKGDTLRLCFGQPGDDPPAAFASKEGDQTALTEYKREKK